MKNSIRMLMVLAVAGTAVTAWSGCEVDESAPSRPRTAATPLTPDEATKDRAFNRENEEKKRELPTSGAEFPGQSRATSVDEKTVAAADSVNRVLLLSDVAPAQSSYQHDYYHGPMPHLPENPGKVPMAGETPVPGSPWTIENSTGQVLQLQDYPHRAWPEMQTQYVGATVRHNPVYYFNVQEKVPVPQNDGTVGGNVVSTLYEVPWFYGNTAALPVLMILQPPLIQVHTTASSQDPQYHGYLPATGPIVPSPTPGIIRWEYSFYKRDAVTQPTTMPSGETPVNP